MHGHGWSGSAEVALAHHPGPPLRSEVQVLAHQPTTLQDAVVTRPGCPRAKPYACGVEELEVTACQFVVGEIPAESLPDIATQALVREVDSPSLRELAGLRRNEVREAADLFLSSLTELGLALPTRDEALWRLVRMTAARVVSGEVPPYQGALWIWTRAAHEVEEEGDLRIFIGLASERQDHPDAGNEIDAQIVDAARELLARDHPRQWLRLQARRGELPLSRSKSHGLKPVLPADLQLSPDLATALTCWAADYEATFDSDPDESGFESQGAAEAFVQRGRTLAGDLQRELGESWRVEFYPEPIRPPGLRLRTR